MQKELAKKIVESAECTGIEVSLYEGYSGRGMYGKKTDGVYGRLNDVIKCIAFAFYELGMEEGEKNMSEDEDEDQDEEPIDIDKMNFRFDSLGQDTIIY